MAIPMPGELGWFVNAPDSMGEYLVVDAAYRQRHIADWLPSDGKKPGRWFMRGRPFCGADEIVCWRPLPRIPMREPNHSEV